jgi:hypothetical protein
VAANAEDIIIIVVGIAILYALFKIGAWLWGGLQSILGGLPGTTTTGAAGGTPQGFQGGPSFGGYPAQTTQAGGIYYGPFGTAGPSWQQLLGQKTGQAISNLVGGYGGGLQAPISTQPIVYSSPYAAPPYALTPSLPAYYGQVPRGALLALGYGMQMPTPQPMGTYSAPTVSYTGPPLPTTGGPAPKSPGA